MSKLKDAVDAVEAVLQGKYDPTKHRIDNIKIALKPFIPEEEEVEKLRELLRGNQYISVSTGYSEPVYMCAECGTAKGNICPEHCELSKALESK